MVTTMFRRKRRQAIFALTLGIVGVGGVLASAASLNIANSTLGAGTTVIASCDTNGVTLVYTNVYVPASGRYDTTAVTVNGLNNLCNGKRLDLTLKTNTGTSLGTGSIASLNLPTGTTSATVTLTPAANANQVRGAAVVITG
jgi:hypothetical protein